MGFKMKLANALNPQVSGVVYADPNAEVVPIGTRFTSSSGMTFVKNAYTKEDLAKLAAAEEKARGPEIINAISAGTARDVQMPSNVNFLRYGRDYKQPSFFTNIEQPKELRADSQAKRPGFLQSLFETTEYPSDLYYAQGGIVDGRQHLAFGGKTAGSILRTWNRAPGVSVINPPITPISAYIAPTPVANTVRKWFKKGVGVGATNTNTGSTSNTESTSNTGSTPNTESTYVDLSGPTSPLTPDIMSAISGSSGRNVRMPKNVDYMRYGRDYRQPSFFSDIDQPTELKVAQPTKAAFLQRLFPEGYAQPYAKGGMAKKMFKMKNKMKE